MTTGQNVATSALVAVIVAGVAALALLGLVYLGHLIVWLWGWTA